MSLWQPIGTHCLSMATCMATCDLFPQNIAIFVVFFPKKKLLCNLNWDFLLSKWKKIAQKTTNQRPKYYKTTLVHPKSCKFEWYTLFIPSLKSNLHSNLKFYCFWIFNEKSYSIFEYLISKNTKSPPCNPTHQTIECVAQCLWNLL